MDETALKVNYFIGNDPAKWHAAVPTSGAVLYKNIYNRIDLKVYGIESRIEYDWIVRPGGDPRDIRFEYRNVKGTRVDEAGNLLVETGFGDLMHKKPAAYQEAKDNLPPDGRSENGTRAVVESNFKKIAENVYGFEIGAYEADLELVIDPVVLAYSTYLGGNNDEFAHGIAVDGSGNAYVTGTTYSTDFPILNHYQTDPGDGTADVFVTKLATTLSGPASLIYSTYLGGNGIDYGYGIAVDNGGNAYVTGETQSTDFPTLNQYQTDQGYGDAFVTKLDTTKNGNASLVYSTYLGGSQWDTGFGIAVDDSGNAYVAGNASNTTDFPVLNQYQTYQGLVDAFVTKFDTTQSGPASLIYSTYLGGSAQDYAFGIAVGASGNAYVVGCTYSTNFPTLNQYQTDPGDLHTDAYVAKIDTTQSGPASLVYSTYLGGSSDDGLWNNTQAGIAVDGSGNAYVTGWTDSTNFPTLNPYQTDQGLRDAFAAKLDTTKNGTASLVYSTYLGGNNDDQGYGIAVDGSGNAYLTGTTYSTNFPTLNQYQTEPGDGNCDAFVTKLDTTQSGEASLVYSTYLGGSSSDFGYGTAVDGSGTAYVTGRTESTNFPTLNQYQADQTTSDVFIAKLRASTVPDTFSFIDQTGMPVSTVIASNPITVAGIDIAAAVSITGGEYAVSTDAGSTWGGWTSAPGTVDLDDQVKVRQTSSSSNSTLTTATLTIGGISDSFDVTTAASGDPRAIGLVSWWKAENNADDSVGVHPGTTAGGVAYLAGRDGQAFSLDGADDSVDVGNWFNLQSFTISLWINPAAAQLANADIIDNYHSSVSPRVSWGMQQDGSTTNRYSFFAFGPTAWAFPHVYFTLPANQWTHVVVTRDASTRTGTVYINGSVLPTVTGSESISYDGSESLHFGRHDRIAGRTWAGQLDDIQVYNRALSAGEVAMLDDDIYEDNDTPATAAALVPGTYPGLILRDEDYFKVYVEAGKDLQVSITGAALPPASGGDLDIEVYDVSGNLLVASTGGSTNETVCLSNLAAGWYVIRNAWYGTAHGCTLTIASGDLPLGEISGRVTDIRGAGIAKVWVMFYEPGGDWNLVRGYAPTDINGDYHFAYTTGDHRVKFDTTYPACQVVGSYVNEWYNDAATLGAAQTLTTQPGQSLTGIDAVLGDAGMVTGVVTGPEGQLLQYAYAQAYDSSGTMYASTYTFADGTYRLRGIASAGNYLIRFRPPANTPYAVEWYSDKGWSGAADAVPVVLGEATPNINAQLGYGGSISGQVTAAGSGLPIANVTVRARDENNIGIYDAVTGADGQYTIYWVPAGNIKLRFNAGMTGYSSEWYNDKADFATADLMTLTAGQNVTGINAQLLPATLTIASPNGGESWMVGLSHDITWSSTGASANVRLEFSANNGTDWSDVIASTPNDGSYSWTIPDTPSTTCLIRVSDAAYPPTNDDSNAVFAIVAFVAPSVTVTSPNGWENWTAGSGHDITWTTTGTIANVDISYSADRGSHWIPVAAGTDNDGLLTWTVPNTPSTQCLVRVSDAANAAVTDGSQTVFAILAPGSLAAWGYNAGGQTNVPAGNNYVAVAAGDLHSVALKADGSLAAWGDNGSGQTNVPPGNDYTAITSGQNHNLALKADRSLVAWGLNDYGQCNIPAGNNYVAFGAGGFFSVALKADGSLVAWGRNNYGQLDVPAGNDYVAIAAGRYHVLALKADGSLVAWGRNNYGQINVPAGNDYVAVAGELNQSMVLKADGSLVAWGENGSGQCNVPAGNDYAAIACGYWYSLALKADGSLTAWGDNVLAQCDVPAGNRFVAATAGYYHGLAIAETSVIAGMVTIGGAGFANVVLSGLPGDPVTDSSGAYSASAAYNWSGTVVPTLAGYAFTPVSREYSNVIADQTAQDYTASIIPNTITVTSPNGGENLTVGAANNITWTSTGVVGNIKIEYSIDSGSHYSEVVASTANDGSFSWPVPNTPSTACLVRVSETDGSPWDVSNAVFTIEAATPPLTSGLAVDFGPVGLFIFENFVWTQVSGVNPESMAAADTDGDGAGELVVDFGSVGAWLVDGSAWTQLSGVNADGLIAADTDGDLAGEIVGDFGTTGLWLWNGAWTQLSGVNADGMIAADIDADGADEVVGDFGTTGLWLWSGGSWTQMSGVNADGLMAANVDPAAGKEIVADFGAIGLWLWKAGAWTQISGVNAEGMAAGRIDGDAEEEVLVDFVGLGVWLYNAGAWSQISGANPEQIIAANFTADAGDELVVDFGAIGIWQWDNDSWVQISGINPELLVAANTDLDVELEVAADFGSLGLWLWNNGIWNTISNVNPENIIAKY